MYSSTATVSELTCAIAPENQTKKFSCVQGSGPSNKFVTGDLWRTLLCGCALLFVLDQGLRHQMYDFGRGRAELADAIRLGITDQSTTDHKAQSDHLR